MKPVPKAGAMVNVGRNNAQLAPAARVPGHAPRVQVRVQAAHRVVIHKAIAARHHVVTPRPQVLALLTAPVARSEQAQVWVLAHVPGRVPVHQVAQRLAAPVATKQIALVVQLFSTSNLHAHRLAAPACKIRHHEYSN